jgi:hypothetical protein
MPAVLAICGVRVGGSWSEVSSGKSSRPYLRIKKERKKEKGLEI